MRGEALHARTAGNPFYVTEALEAGEEIPDSVRDAVLARAARLPGAAREVLDAVAIVPNRAELWLLEALTEGELEPCLASGMLRAERDAVAFRTRSPARRSRRRCRPIAGARCTAGRSRPWRRAAHDLARLAHHADAAGDARGGRCAMRRRRASTPPRSARTARRRRSSPARCATPTATARPCSSGARTSAT